MYNYLFTPRFSILIRGTVLTVILIFVVLFFYGYSPLMRRDIFTYLASETLVLDERSALFFKYVIPVVFLFILPVFIKTRELYVGLIHFTAVYSSLLLVIITICFTYIIYIKYVYVREYTVELCCLVMSLCLLLFNIILTTLYPLIAIGFSRVDRSGRTGSLIIKSNTIFLNSGEVIRVRIYGDYSNIGFRSIPENSIKISNWSRTLYYKYVDIYPLSSFGGYIELFFKDRLIYRFKCIYSSIDYRKIRFNTYFNDDYIGSYELSIEIYKNLLESIEPLLDSIVSKIGISKSDISNIVFYTKDKVHIPRETTLADLVGIDEVDVMIYSVEKHMEVYKYYGKRDIYDLWETLVKRLEFLRREMSSLLSEIESVRSNAKVLHSNWW